jgi:hypothetical protein
MRSRFSKARARFRIKFLHLDAITDQIYTFNSPRPINLGLESVGITSGSTDRLHSGNRHRCYSFPSLCRRQYTSGALQLLSCVVSIQHHAESRGLWIINSQPKPRHSTNWLPSEVAMMLYFRRRCCLYSPVSCRFTYWSRGLQGFAAISFPAEATLLNYYCFPSCFASRRQLYLTPQKAFLSLPNLNSNFPRLHQQQHRKRRNLRMKCN